MRIAVIIPVYNVTTFLEEAVKSAVTQAYPDQEVVVVNDGSAPEHAAEIADICERYPEVILLHQSHQGTAAARDFGVAYGMADLIVFLDGDDILLPGVLQYFADAIRSTPDAIAVYARFVNIDESGHVISGLLPTESSIGSGPQVLELFLQGKSPFRIGSICILRKALQALSVNNYHLKIGEDWVLWCHLALSGNIVPAGNRVVLHRRIHQQNISWEMLTNLELALAPPQVIFAHPAFKAAVGDRKLEALQELCLCRLHAYLASTYAAKSQPEQAMFHLQQITLPLTVITS